MAVYLCEGYGLGYLGLPWAGPGGLEHPLRHGLDTTSATGQYFAQTAGTGILRDPGRERAAEGHGPPAGLRDPSGPGLLAGRGLYVPTHLYLRPCRPLGPIRARGGNGPKELLISEQLGM